MPRSLRQGSTRRRVAKDRTRRAAAGSPRVARMVAATRARVAAWVDRAKGSTRRGGVNASTRRGGVATRRGRVDASRVDRARAGTRVPRQGSTVRGAARGREGSRRVDRDKGRLWPAAGVNGRPRTRKISRRVPPGERAKKFFTRRYPSVRKVQRVSASAAPLSGPRGSQVMFRPLAAGNVGPVAVAARPVLAAASARAPLELRPDDKAGRVDLA